MGQLIADTGDMMQRLTNGQIPGRVSAPAPQALVIQCHFLFTAPDSELTALRM